MIIHNQTLCENGFLPSVKTRPLIHSKPKKSSSQKYRRTNKYKLSITQQNDIQKNVPYLIEDYYRRFKMQTHKCSPLSVSINFKPVSQEEIESKNSKIKQQKIKISFTKNKAKSLSQDSYTIKLHKKKADICEKINLSAKTILHRLKSFPACQNQNLDHFINNHLISKSNINGQTQAGINFGHSQSIEFINEGNSTKGFAPKGKIFLQKQKLVSQNEMSSFQRVSLKKKSRNPFKTIEQSTKMSFRLDKNITPWINQQKSTYENPQQSIALLQKSLQV